MTDQPTDTPQTLLKNIAVNLKTHRLRLGFSQEEFADLCGYHRTYVGAIERSERNITISTLCALAETLGLTPIDLLRNPNENAE